MQWCLAAKAKSTLNSSITAYRSSRLPVLRSRSTSAGCWCPCSLRRSVSREADLEAIAAPNHEGNGHRKHWEQNHEADVRVLQRRQVSHKHWRLERFQWCRTCRWCHCFNSPRHFYRGNEAKGKRAQDVAACCHTQQHCQGWAARSGHVLPPAISSQSFWHHVSGMSTDWVPLLSELLLPMAIACYSNVVTPESFQYHLIPALGLEVFHTIGCFEEQTAAEQGHKKICHRNLK